MSIQNPLHKYLQEAKNVEATQMSIKWWVDKNVTMYPYDDYSSAILKEDVLIHAIKWVYLKTLYIIWFVSYIAVKLIWQHNQLGYCCKSLCPSWNPDQWDHSLTVKLKHQCFLKFPRWLHCVAKIENHSSRISSNLNELLI